MSYSSFRNPRFASRVLGLGVIVLGASAFAAGGVREPIPSSATPLRRPAPAESGDFAALREAIVDSLYGRSGKLRLRFVGGARGSLEISVVSRLFGDSVEWKPGIYALPDTLAERPLAFLTLLPFESKAQGRIGDYRIGYWPGERRAVPSAYANPDGFIEVTPENQDTRVSEHFRLRDFLTKDQKHVWPKYLVLREALVDKLELVIAEMERSGVNVERMVVMSGFRTPQYNRGGGDPSGRAELSRHMYGDAADVFVDNDGNGRMDDLNRDGRVDHRDAQVIHLAAERVEQRHDDLVGGIGVYRANRAHGPFAHIDVRGHRARWGQL